MTCIDFLLGHTRFAGLSNSERRQPREFDLQVILPSSPIPTEIYASICISKINWYYQGIISVLKMRSSAYVVYPKKCLIYQF